MLHSIGVCHGPCVCLGVYRPKSSALASVTRKNQFKVNGSKIKVFKSHKAQVRMRHKELSDSL